MQSACALGKIGLYVTKWLLRMSEAAVEVAYDRH